MKNIRLCLIFLFVGINYCIAQRNKVYVESNIYHHSQADVDARYRGYCEIKDLAWSYYNKADYEQAIYYAKRISTSIIDQDYLYTEKVKLLCLCYAHLGEKDGAEKYFYKLQKKGSPNDIKSVAYELEVLGLVKITYDK